MRRIQRISSQLSLLEAEEFERDMQCPHCKSRRGYYKLYSDKTDTARYRKLICKKCACVSTTIEEYPEGYSPNVKYKVKTSFASVQARHRTYIVDRVKGIMFDTKEIFEHAEPQYATIDNRRG